MLNVNLINNKMDLKNIKWEEVFMLFEFKSYLERNEFTEISLLSKLLREKLRHKIFYKININDDFLLQFPNYFYHSRLDIKNEFDEESENLKKFQISRIDPFIADLIKKLSTFGGHLKQIEFDRLYRPGYFIVPLIRDFNHLTSLSICDCELELKSFNKFILKLCKLGSLSIKDLQFLVLDEEWPLDSKTILPQTLKVLELGSMRLRKTDIHKNSFKFLIDDSGFMNGYYYIPAQHLPNLKQLIISENIYYYSDYIPNLLDSNPQLMHITFPCYYLSSSVVKSLSTASNINGVQIMFKYDNYTLKHFDNIPIYSVNTLSIQSIPSSHYSEVFIIINLFSKLTKFHASFDYFDGDFIEILLVKLDSLKVIELEIQYFSDEGFDLSIFSNIESLKLDIFSRKMICYKLPAQLSNLKLIKITSNNNLESFNHMLEHYKNSSIWNIKLLGKVISCRPIAD